MILSHALKLIFIKGRKVGGTSVEIGLSLVCGPHDIVTPISVVDERIRLSLGGTPRNYSSDPEGEARFVEAIRKGEPKEIIVQPSKLFRNHMPLIEVKKRYKGDLAGYRVVGVARSPYSRLISFANWRLRIEGYNGEQVANDRDTIRSYIDETIEGKQKVPRDVDLYRDETGEVVAQFLRYENLHDDFAALLRSVGVTQSVPLPHAKKGIMASTIDPRDMLTREQLDWINREFADEFEQFGYERL